MKYLTYPAPETVRSLMGTAMSSRSMNISWQQPEGIQKILDYHITISPLNGNSPPRNFTTTSTSIVVDLLHPDSFYLCTVASRVSIGLQPSTNVLLKLPADGENTALLRTIHICSNSYRVRVICHSFLFPTSAPSAHPQNVRAVASDSSTLHLTWIPPPLEEQNGNIVQYGINITNLQSGKVAQFLTSDSSATYTVSGLHPYYLYNYTVTAFTSVGHGPYSPPGYVQMPQDGKPGFVLNILKSFMIIQTMQLKEILDF